MNNNLAPYQDAWDSAADAWLVVRVGDPQWVFRWRLQAEHAMRAAGRTGAQHSRAYAMSFAVVQQLLGGAKVASHCVLRMTRLPEAGALVLTCNRAQPGDARPCQPVMCASTHFCM